MLGESSKKKINWTRMNTDFILGKDPKINVWNADEALETRYEPGGKLIGALTGIKRS